MRQWIGSVSIGSDNGLSPIRHQAIIETNDRLLSTGTLGKKLQWNFNQNIEHLKFISYYRLRNGGHFVQGELKENFPKIHLPVDDLTDLSH